ncbi:MAG TPA: CapA family protein [Acidimicrobiia bacterium]|nr:CapA family protein [Acidimicrobiia bacterium]
MRAALCAVVVAGLLVAAPSADSGTPPRGFTIAAAGDIIPHEALVDAGDRYLPGAGWDFTAMLADIEPWVSSADLGLCHFEGTLSPTSTGLSGYPRFIGPREMADAIVAAGWDGCSTASNHAMDGGWTGVVGTLEVLDAAGLAHAGTARDPEERLPTLYEVNGVTVAHISYTYGTNGILVPQDRPWAVNVIDAAAILADAEWARDHGSEFTVVSLHWGLEYHISPTGAQRSLAELLLASPDVDLILGHHAHVVQPIERIGDKYVVYGMGNHVSNQFSRWGPDYANTEDGLLVRVKVMERPGGGFEVTGIEVVPTWVQFGTYRVLAAGDPPPDEVASAATIAASHRRTLATATSLDAPGVEPVEVPFAELTCTGIRATIVGTPDNDVLLGTAGDDVIVGRGGDDHIFGMEGDDLICGDEGDDVIAGGPGRDVLHGGPGIDRVITDVGDVRLGACLTGATCQS